MFSEIKPLSVFKYFEEICGIPHGSGNEKRLSDHLRAFGEGLGLETVQDEALNVIIRKPGTPGYEHKPEVILQGHMDMVCEKNKNVVFDFENDPLNIYIDGDFIKARGTTLGADNGVAVAYIMALMASTDIPHPPLCGVITVEEETGLRGAGAIDKQYLSGKYLINMDSEDEGTFLSGCAGGVRCDVTLREETLDTVNPAELGLKGFSLEITGLAGGHSGLDIDKELGNSNVCLARVLLRMMNQFDVFIASASGGSKDNAIPREAECIFYVAEGNVSQAEEIAKTVLAELKNEYKTTDPGVDLCLKAVSPPCTAAFSALASRRIVSTLTLLPNGIYTRNTDIGIVECSDNVAVIDFRADTKKASIKVSVRSSVESRKRDLVEKITEAARVNGGIVETGSDYPGWEYNPVSPLRELFIATYKDLTGQDAQIAAIHAGVECGILSDKNPALDIICMGPNMHSVHTPDEAVSISSMARVWDFLLEILKRL